MALNNNNRYYTPDYSGKKKKDENKESWLSQVSNTVKNGMKNTANSVMNYLAENLPENRPDGGTVDPYPTYSSPTAGAAYSYNGQRPTWSWDREAPTFTWDQQAPTWQWDENGRPGEFTWDESKRPGEFAYDGERPVYDSRYDPQIQDLARQILNREAFSYDYNKDPLYAQYAEAYTRNGNNAMQDTLAQVSARTGGLASSYAGTAAQNTYNSYMQALNDKIPELQQIAYNMYRDTGNDMRSNMSMLQGLENMDYGRYQDALGQYNIDRNLAYNQWANQLDQFNADRNFAYQQNQDAWNRYYNDRNFSYGQFQDLLNQYNADRALSFDEFQTMMNQYNNDRGFEYGVYADQMDQYNKDRTWDYNLWSDNLSRQEAAAKAAYNARVAAWNAANSGKGSSNSSSSGTGSNTPSTTDSANTNERPTSGNAPMTAEAVARQMADAYREDPDQYDYGVWNTRGGYEYMGKTYSDKDSLFNAIANSGTSDTTLVNTIETMLMNGVITQAEYNDLMGRTQKKTASNTDKRRSNMAN